jgi:hypothetical protein
MGRVSALIGQRTFKFWALSALVVSMAVLAGGIAYGTTASCNNTQTLNNSAFEVDTNANLVVNTTGCVDWLTGGAGTQMRTGVTVKQDTASGQNDESFGNGTKEDTAVPSIVAGGIPPNKSDLKAFGLYTEQGEVTAANPTGKYLALFWTRVQDPSGTTNMDFELNQSSVKSANGVTPVRTSGDKLITYDLSNGGTVATISIRTWSGSAWGSPTVISGSNTGARGSINTSQIASNASGGLGTLDARTFGEATISFNTLFGTNQCGRFGSAYLKSRSADTFTSALKDFVPPTAVNISNCSALTTNATESVTIGSPIKDTAHLTDVTATAGGSITFKAYSDSNCSTLKFTSNAIPVNGPGDYSSNEFTPDTVGTYYWIANYTGDANNTAIDSKCGDANESSVVNQAKPAISTSATTPGNIGDSVKDTATLSGASTNPAAGGSITFKLYSSLADCNAGTNAVFTDTKPVSGNGNYTSGDFTPNAVGTYYWLASYSGDTNNAEVSGACGDTGEQSVIAKAPSNISTEQELFPQDMATVSATAGGDPTGSVKFELFSTADCSGPSVFSETVQLTNGMATTNNTTFSVDASNDGAYNWLVTYSGDGTHDGETSACGKENFTTTVNNG